MNRSIVQPIKRDEIVGYWERLDLDAEEVRSTITDVFALTRRLILSGEVVSCALRLASKATNEYQGSRFLDL
jgi:hypothetical protein